jgi:hypothetical protein
LPVHLESRLYAHRDEAKPSAAPASRGGMGLGRRWLTPRRCSHGWHCSSLSPRSARCARDLVPALGEAIAHQVATLWACAMVFAGGFLYVLWARPTRREALYTGALWLALAMVFELGFFGFVMGRPWDVLLADYNIFRGRLLVLLWLFLLLAPYVSARLAQRLTR